MCYREEEMLPYAYCYLHEMFPKWKGWNMNFLRDEQHIFPDFMIERLNKSTITRIIVMVRMNKYITDHHIIEMTKYERMVRLKKKYQVKKIIIVPTGCDISIVPSDIKIISLKEFHLQTA